MKRELPTLVQSSLLKETRQTHLSCDDSSLPKLQARGTITAALVCPSFVFVVIYEMKTRSAKITLHSWKELWELPLSIWQRGRNIPQYTSFVLCSLFDVQVTGGVSCDRFDVELLDFIVTSMPTRRAVSHFSHLNNHAFFFTAPLLQASILKYMFSHSCCLPHYLCWERAVLKHNYSTHIFCKHPEVSSDGW